MLRTLVTSLLLFGSLAGCKPTLLPDPLGAHKLARDEKVQILVRHPDGTQRRQKVKLPAGSVCASPEAIRAAQAAQPKP